MTVPAVLREVLGELFLRGVRKKGRVYWTSKEQKGILCSRKQRGISFMEPFRTGFL